MDETVTVLVLSLIGFVEVDHQQHQMYDLHAHLDIIKITLPIQNIELQDELMVIEQRMRSVMTRMTMMEMVVAQFAA